MDGVSDATLLCVLRYVTEPRDIVAVCGTCKWWRSVARDCGITTIDFHRRRRGGCAMRNGSLILRGVAQYKQLQRFHAENIVLGGTPFRCMCSFLGQLFGCCGKLTHVAVSHCASDGVSCLVHNEAMVFRDDAASNLEFLRVSDSHISAAIVRALNRSARNLRTLMLPGSLYRHPEPIGPSNLLQTDKDDDDDGNFEWHSLEFVDISSFDSFVTAADAKPWVKYFLKYTDRDVLRAILVPRCGDKADSAVQIEPPVYCCDFLNELFLVSLHGIISAPACMYRIVTTMTQDTAARLSAISTIAGAFPEELRGDEFWVIRHDPFSRSIPYLPALPLIDRMFMYLGSLGIGDALRVGFPPDLREEECGGTVLSLAIGRGLSEVALALLRCGASIATAKVDENLALFRENLSESLLVELVKAGANVNARDPSKRTPLHIACRKSMVMFARSLVEYGADVSAADSDGRTPLVTLCMGVRRGDELKAAAIARALLAAGASVDELDPATGRNCLHTALRANAGQFNYGNTSVCSPALIGELMSSLPAGRFADEAAHLRDGGGFGSICALSDDPHFVATLVNSAPDLIDGRDECDGVTPLIATISSNRVDTAKFLLQSGASVSVKDNNGRTALRAAVDTNNAELVAAVLLHGGTTVVSEPDKAGVRPLNAACANASHKIAEILLTNGASVNALDGRGMTALFHCRNVETFSLLVSHGADVSVRDPRGKNVLHHAAEQGNLGLVQAILAVNPALKFEADVDGRKPYDATTNRGVHLLLGSGQQMKQER